MSGASRSLLLGLSAISLGTLMAITAFGWLSGSGQGKIRVVEQTKLIHPDIVPIVGIQQSNRSISVGKEFNGEVDWLRGMKFRVRNDSGKEIVHLAFELEFPETAASGSVMIFPIWAGHRPGSIIFGKQRTLSLKPGQELTISIEEPTYSQMVKFIELRHQISEITKVVARVQFVAFDDSTGWSGGEYLRQDPARPEAYIPIRQR